VRVVTRFLLALFLVVLAAGRLEASASPARADVLDLLRKAAADTQDSGALATLFAVGDEHIDVLIRALHDPDLLARANAQRLIRYLGNSEGMDALVAYYCATDGQPMAGPLTFPISRRDFGLLERLAASEDNFISESGMYVYALAVDGSPEASDWLTR
jgi:hypothetical protein